MVSSTIRITIISLVSFALLCVKCSDDNTNPVYGLQDNYPCEQGTCYTATGNLLIGREKQLHTSSTCGLYEAQRYCIVSHLEDRKSCFRCDSREQNHNITNIIYQFLPGTRQKSWWQSENGKENVTIQLDLKSEFHFTHLIMVFKTFRPAALLIERSYDFGQTWKVYQYFASDCAKSFPGVYEGLPRNLSDTVCESKYSSVAPSSDGEVIFRVLANRGHIENPYDKEVQDLLRITNLRINFTKLHTLGDDLLDNRQEIQEKYYYAISHMIVRGSCFCYGHAIACLPISNSETHPDMVHGRCKCIHNTRGEHCNECEDLYNDLKWQPAIGKQKNVCKMCRCNNHATRCHFDEDVFERSGRIGGGVCDDCDHHTTGTNCERCESFFYRDPARPIDDPHVCVPCDCDLRGTIDNGLCETVDASLDSSTTTSQTIMGYNQAASAAAASDASMTSDSLIAGQCHCKRNVLGRQCNQCKNGYWNFTETNPDGCEPCKCNLVGTVDNLGCNFNDGECICKRLVTGHNCDRCLDEYWGLSEKNKKDGCQACECDRGGAFDNRCDQTSGQCKCRDYVQGRKCDQPDEQHFVASLDFYVYEAEDVNNLTPQSQVVIRESYRDGRNNTWTGQGFVRNFDRSSIEFVVDNIQTDLDYEIVFRYEPQFHEDTFNAILSVESLEKTVADPTAAGDSVLLPDVAQRRNECYERFRSTFADRTRTIRFQQLARHIIVEPAICLQSNRIYKIRLDFQNNQNLQSSSTTSPGSVLIDSMILIPKLNEIPFLSNEIDSLEEIERYRCVEQFYDVNQALDASRQPEICKKILNSVSLYVYNGAFECECDATGSLSKYCSEYGGVCACKPNVIGRRCDRCAPGTFDFGPKGCRPCECNHIGALNNFCDQMTGQCKCQNNSYGLACDQCEPGFWNFPNCQRCNCNGHADQCDARTGDCFDCQDFTAGMRCDRCLDGYYGDPRFGVDIACRPCPCPLVRRRIEGGNAGRRRRPSSNQLSFADRCSLDPVTNDVICECELGYAGLRCDVCADNYYGNLTRVLNDLLRNPDSSDDDDDDNDDNDKDDDDDDDDVDDVNDTVGNGIETPAIDSNDYASNAMSDVNGARDLMPASPSKIRATEEYCKPCECNQNIDLMKPGNCDQVTGKCMNCLFNTAGDHCEYCKKGFYRLAKDDLCVECTCDLLGTNHTAGTCNQNTGQCECLANVVGTRCDACLAYHWKIASGQGCEPCNCDPVGSAHLQCNLYDGQCVCNDGFGGSRCNQCEKYYWGDPNDKCYRCDCNPDGSLSMQCHHTNGSCICVPGIGGQKCDVCDVGYLGQAPFCSPCGECFDNWHDHLTALEAKSKVLIERAAKIKQIGATGAYTKQFDEIESNLKFVTQLLSNKSMHRTDIESIDRSSNEFGRRIDDFQKQIEKIENSLSNSSQVLLVAEIQLEDLKGKTNVLRNLTNEYRQNGTLLKETIVTGALSLTNSFGQQAAQHSREVDKIQDTIADTIKWLTRTETLFNQNDLEFDIINEKIQNSYEKIDEHLKRLRDKIPDLNEKVCDHRGDPCDEYCGGAGCDSCGGISCDDGMVTRSEKSYDLAKKSFDLLSAKENQIDEFLRNISLIKLNTTSALDAAKRAHFQSYETEQLYDRILEERNSILSAIEEFDNKSKAKPEDIRKLTNEILKKDIHLKPEKISELSERIQQNVKSLTGIESILNETSPNLQRSQWLRSETNATRNNAGNLLERANEIIQKLTEAENMRNMAKIELENAKSSIHAVENNFEDIKKETDSAQIKINTSLVQVESLRQKLKNIQQKSLKNDLDIVEIESKINDINNQSLQSKNLAMNLKNKYAIVNQSILEKSDRSVSLRDRAKELLKRSSTLTTETNNKLRSLNDLQKENHFQSDNISSLSKKINELNSQMRHYLDSIMKKSEHYRHC